MEVLSFVKEGDVESVKAWWLINVDGSTLTRDQLLVFLEACGFGHESMVFSLWGLIPSVSKTVLLEKDNYFGILKAASRSGNVSLFQFLWEKGIDIKSNREVIIECITLACQGGHVSMLKYLFDKIKHFYKGTVLEVSKLNGHVSLTTFPIMFILRCASSDPDGVHLCRPIGTASSIGVY